MQLSRSIRILVPQCLNWGMMPSYTRVSPTVEALRPAFLKPVSRALQGLLGWMFCIHDKAMVEPDSGGVCDVLYGFFSMCGPRKDIT